MKFEDVLPAFREGKKIRRQCWVSDEVFYTGCATQNGALLEGDWEVVEEPKKPMVFEGICFTGDGRYDYLMGFSTKEFNSFSYDNIQRGKKYRITVEEII